MDSISQKRVEMDFSVFLLSIKYTLCTILDDNAEIFPNDKKIQLWMQYIKIPSHTIIYSHSSTNNISKTNNEYIWIQMHYTFITTNDLETFGVQQSGLYLISIRMLFVCSWFAYMWSFPTLLSAGFSIWFVDCGIWKHNGINISAAHSPTY